MGFYDIEHYYLLVTAVLATPWLFPCTISIGEWRTEPLLLGCLPLPTLPPISSPLHLCLKCYLRAFLARQELGSAMFKFPLGFFLVGK